MSAHVELTRLGGTGRKVEISRHEVIGSPGIAQYRLNAIHVVNGVIVKDGTKCATWHNRRKAARWGAEVEAFSSP